MTHFALVYRPPANLAVKKKKTWLIFPLRGFNSDKQGSSVTESVSH